MLAAGPVQAQIVTDGTVGPKVSLQGGEIEIGADLGARRGENLFHSFEKFGIATGQSATFTGPGAIKNVISRVTGGEISNIDGKLASEVGQADLYFLNPAGVMFGPNATLDVPGSFHVSTAHELRFDNGVSFSALDKTDSGLTVAAPEAFGFLDRPLGSIRIDQRELRLMPGKVLSLVGGDLAISGGQTGSLGAQDGVVQLVSAAAPGVVRIADAATAVDQRGEVRVTQSGERQEEIGTPGMIDVSGPNGGGTIRIRGGQVILNGAWIFADNNGNQNSIGGIDVQTDSLMMLGGYLTADALRAGQGGMITITTKDLQLHDGATLASNSRVGAIGSAGTIMIQTDHLLVAGGNGKDTQIATNTSTTGNAGDIAITAKSLELQPGGWIRSEALALERPSGSSGTGSSGTGSSGTGSSGTGSSGTITIQTDELLASGSNSDPAGIETRSNSARQGGRIVITPKEREGQIVLRGNVQINSDTYGSGPAGTVTIQTRSMSLTNGAQVRTQSLGSNVTSAGGSITIEAADVLSLDHAAIEASTTTAEGGNVTLAVGRLFDLNNSTVTTSVAGGKGSGGNIVMNSHLMVLNDSQILANAFGGPGGNITIRAGQLIRTPEPHSVIQASSKENVSGTITITAQNTDVSSSLVILPETFLDASGQLRETCAARAGRPTSSLSPGGRGGLPPDPAKPLAASSFGQPLEQQTATGSPTPLAVRPPQAVKPITVAGIPQPVLGSPRLTCRG